MLTLKDLMEMPKHHTFKQGKTAEFKYTAVRGNVSDWAIYVGDHTKSYEEISQWGDKIHDRRTIKELVPCDEEAYQQYRH